MLKTIIHLVSVYERYFVSHLFSQQSTIATWISTVCSWWSFINIRKYSQISVPHASVYWLMSDIRWSWPAHRYTFFFLLSSFFFFFLLNGSRSLPLVAARSFSHTNNNIFFNINIIDLFVSLNFNCNAFFPSNIIVVSIKSVKWDWIVLRAWSLSSFLLTEYFSI